MGTAASVLHRISSATRIPTTTAAAATSSTRPLGFADFLPRLGGGFESKATAAELKTRGNWGGRLEWWEL